MKSGWKKCVHFKSTLNNSTMTLNKYSRIFNCLWHCVPTKSQYNWQLWYSVFWCTFWYYWKHKMLWGTLSHTFVLAALLKCCRMGASTNSKFIESSMWNSLNLYRTKSHKRNHLSCIMVCVCVHMATNPTTQKVCYTKGTSKSWCLGMLQNSKNLKVFKILLPFPFSNWQVEILLCAL